MSNRSRISGGQCVALLLASRLSNCLLLTPQEVSELNLVDRLLSNLLGGVLLLLLLLPTVAALRRSPRGGLIDGAYRRARGWGKTVSGGYAALCLFILCMDIVQFYDFAQKTMKTAFSVPMLTVALIAVAFLASFYGIQALGRTATLVTAFSVVCLVVFAAALLPEMRALHFLPVATGNVTEIVRQAVINLPRTAEIVSVGLLLPYVNGSSVGVCAGFSGFTALFTALVGVTSLGVLGDFAAMTAYPYYAAVTAARIGVFQRLDILVTAVWLSTFFVRFALFCMLFTDSARRLFVEAARLPAALIGIALLSGFTFLIRDGSFAGEWQVVTVIYWVVLGVFCVLLPTVTWMFGKKRRCSV